MGLLAKAISIQVVTRHPGGLLRKLTVVTGRLAPGGLTGRAAVAPDHAGGGLLLKSMIFMKVDREDPDTGDETHLIVDPGGNSDRLLARVQSLVQDFSFFPGLFTLLTEELHLPQSALFLFNGYRGRFTPWLSRGLDPSLSAALAFTEEQWRAVLAPDFSLGNGRRLFPGLRRELPQPLFLFPFVHQGALAGSLLVCNVALPDAGRAALSLLFQSLSHQAGAAIARIMLSWRDLRLPDRVFSSPEEALPALLESGAGRPETFLVMEIPLSLLFEKLSRAYGGFDRLSFREVFLFVLNAAFSHLGTATPRGEENIVLVARASRHYSVGLLTSTLSQLVADLFKGLFDEPPALSPTRVFEYPGCGMKPLEILAAFD